MAPPCPQACLQVPGLSSPVHISLLSQHFLPHTLSSVSPSSSYFPMSTRVHGLFPLSRPFASSSSSRQTLSAPQIVRTSASLLYQALYLAPFMPHSPGPHSPPRRILNTSSPEFNGEAQRSQANCPRSHSRIPVQAAQLQSPCSQPQRLRTELRDRLLRAHPRLYTPIPFPADGPPSLSPTPM